MNKNVLVLADINSVTTDKVKDTVENTSKRKNEYYA